MELFNDDESAQVTFQDFFEAWIAQQSLNGFYLAPARVNLLVKWLPANAEDNCEGPAGSEMMNTDLPEFQPSQNKAQQQTTASSAAVPQQD